MQRERMLQISLLAPENAGHKLAKSGAVMLAAWLAVCAPAWCHNTPTHWLWSAIAAASTLLLRPSASQLFVTCAMLSTAVAVDFALTPAESILSYCLSAGASPPLLARIFTHANWFPFSTSVMVAAVLLRPTPRSWHALTAAAAQLSMVAVMLLLMEAGAGAVRLLSTLTQTPLTANALVCGMLISMLGYHQLAPKLAGFGPTHYWQATPHD